MKPIITFITTLACLLLSSVVHAQTPAQDINGDGTLNVLVIGSSSSIDNNTVAFSPDQVVVELQSILSADTSIAININVVAKDIYKLKNVTTGISNVFTGGLNYYCHSLIQYYYWPDGRDARMDNLTGNNGVDWDYVVIGADPYIASSLPGYYSLGVNKIAAKVTEGGAIPLLLMMWSKGDTLIDQFEEFTYRTADGAAVEIENIPAGLAWDALPASKKDTGSVHPTPNGAYLTAASIYSHIYNKSASSSQYVYDDSIADITESTLINEKSEIHYSGNTTFISPYKSCEIDDQILVYNHTGTSTENGILTGLQWVVTNAQKTLQFSSTAPIHFNYGRSNMGGGTKEYKIDSSMYDYSFGFPLQDDQSTGEVSMLYGIDKRKNTGNIETDLGVARDMINESELPYARNIPLRTIIAQLMDEVPGIDIYSDTWHLSSDVNKAIGAYMYTMLTSDCALEGDAEPLDSTEWRSWMAHKIGYQTAWNVMYMEGQTPCYSLPVSIISNDDAGDEYLVYPNPTNGDFFIDLGGNKRVVTITITDLVGRLIKSKTYNNSKLLSLKIEEPAGIYLLIIESDNKKDLFRLIKK